MRYRVWDGPLRLWHWLIVALVFAQWASAEWNWWAMDWHFYAGYATLALVVWRALWGFVGSDNARFASFLKGPRSLLTYLPTLGAREPDAHAGHNPLGGWASLVLLLALAAQSTTGLFTSDDILLFGPLAERVSGDTMEAMTGLHSQLTDALVILIAIHLAAVLFHLVWKRENLIGPMLSGDRLLAADPGLRFASWTRALLLAAVSAAAVWLLVAWGSGGWPF